MSSHVDGSRLESESRRWRGHQRRAVLEITPADPRFVGRYVGSVEVFVAVGEGCTQRAVQTIWDNNGGGGGDGERRMSRVSLAVGRSGIRLDDVDRKSEPRSYAIEDIAYCSAERRPHDRVFSWIWRHPASGRLECHAVLCPSVERARFTALALHRAFRSAYTDWKRAKERRARAKAAARWRQPAASAQTADAAAAAADDDDDASDGESALMESIMAQMNIVEEEEISLTDNDAR